LDNLTIGTVAVLGVEFGIIYTTSVTEGVPGAGYVVNEFHGIGYASLPIPLANQSIRICY
jgi:hypothetical protein